MAVTLELIHWFGIVLGLGNTLLRTAISVQNIIGVTIACGIVFSITEPNGITGPLNGSPNRRSKGVFASHRSS